MKPASLRNDGRWDAERHRFVTVIERSSDFVGIASLDGRSQYIYPAELKHVGLSEVAQASFPNIFDFVIPEERPRRAQRDLADRHASREISVLIAVQGYHLKLLIIYSSRSFRPSATAWGSVFSFC
jgi:hypothetical protein